MYSDRTTGTATRGEGSQYLELFHDAHDGLAGLQQHLPGGHVLHHRHLLVHDAEEVDCSRRPQLPIVRLLRLPAEVPLPWCSPSSITIFTCGANTLPTAAFETTCGDTVNISIMIATHRAGEGF